MMISEKIVKKTINFILCKVQWRPLSDRGRIHQTHCTKRSMWGLLNHQTLVYIIKDFFINFIRRRTVWLHKSQDIWATRAYSFLNCIWQGFLFFIFILHVISLAKLVNIVRYAKLHLFNKDDLDMKRSANFIYCKHEHWQ